MAENVSPVGLIDVGALRALVRAEAPRTTVAKPGKSALAESLVLRPMIYRRNSVAWVAARAWRADAKAADLAAFRAAKADGGSALLAAAAEDIVYLAKLLLGGAPVGMVTNIPCGHSRNADCFGKRLAKAVAEALALPFRQIWADRFCLASSHPKEFAKLPPLAPIAEPGPEMLLIDDVASSGWHVEEALTALRAGGSRALALVWISGEVKCA